MQPRLNLKTYENRAQYSNATRTVSLVDLEDGHSHVHVLRRSVAAHVLLVHLQYHMDLIVCKVREC